MLQTQASIKIPYMESRSLCKDILESAYPWSDLCAKHERFRFQVAFVFQAWTFLFLSQLTKMRPEIARSNVSRTGTAHQVGDRARDVPGQHRMFSQAHLDARNYARLLCHGSAHQSGVCSGVGLQQDCINILNFWCRRENYESNGKGITHQSDGTFKHEPARRSQQGSIRQGGSRDRPVNGTGSAPVVEAVERHAVEWTAEERKDFFSMYVELRTVMAVSRLLL